MADYKKISIYNKHDKSPFLGEVLDIQVGKRRRILAGKGNDDLIVSQEGEVLGSQVFAIHEKVDNEKFTKIYERGMVEMFNLSKSGLRVFGYITSIVKPNKGDVIFEIDSCMDYTGYKTVKPILKGISELLNSKFIARSKYHYRYFINPTMFFNGSRVAFIKVYEKDMTIPSQKELKNGKEV